MARQPKPPVIYSPLAIARELRIASQGAERRGRLAESEEPPPPKKTPGPDAQSILLREVFQ